MKNTSVLFLIFASLPATLLAVCPNPMPATFDNVACVNVVESGFSTNSPVVSATSFWDSAACGDDGGAGHDFPYLNSSNGCPAGSETLRILWVTGHAPTADCLTSTGAHEYCTGEYSQQSAPDQIYIYSLYGPSGTTPTPTSGTALANLIAHEIGHPLGLNDDSCDDGIENQNVPASPVLTPDECEQVDKANDVPGESSEDGGIGFCDPFNDPNCDGGCTYDDPDCGGGGGYESGGDFGCGGPCDDLAPGPKRSPSPPPAHS